MVNADKNEKFPSKTFNILCHVVIKSINFSLNFCAITVHMFTGPKRSEMKSNTQLLLLLLLWLLWTAMPDIIISLWIFMGD